MNTLKKNIPVYCLLVLVILTSSNYLQAQGVCTKKLNEARNKFEAGQLDEVQNLLNPCVSSSGSFQTEEELIQARRLLALSYIYKDNPLEAKEQMSAILHKDPLYEIDEDFEPNEYVQLYNSFKVIPRVSIGLKLGSGVVSPNVIVPYSVNETGTETGFYTNRPSFRGGILGEFRILPNTQICLEVLYNQKSLKYSDPVYNFTHLEYLENLAYADAPLTLKYEIGNGTFRPFVRAGVTGSMFLLSAANLTRTYPGSPKSELQSTNLNTSSQRARFDWTGLIGGGLAIQAGTGKVLIEGRFRPYITNITNPDNRYDNDRLMFEYYYIHDDLGIDNIEFSVAYAITLYSIKERERRGWE